MLRSTRCALYAAGVLAFVNLYQAGYISAQREVSATLRDQIHTSTDAHIAPLARDIADLKAMWARREIESQDVINWASGQMAPPPKLTATHKTDNSDITRLIADKTTRKPLR